MARAKMGQIIDLMQDHEAVDTEDRLTKLPSELLHLIFDYLFAKHTPEKAFDDLDRLAKTPTKVVLPPPPPCSHELDYVAATCKHLRSETSNWALHFLKQHENITKFKLSPERAKEAGTLNLLRGKSGLLTWSSKHCVFCGKKSKRNCILMNGLRCCMKCDKVHWSDKISKTEANTAYNLRGEVLIPSRYHDSPYLRNLAPKFPDGFPRIWYGTYMSCGVPTTMFLRKDVEWLASQYKGDLKAYMAKREAAKENRRRRKEVLEKKAKEQAVTAASTADASIFYTIDDD